MPSREKTRNIAEVSPFTSATQEKNAIVKRHKGNDPAEFFIVCEKEDEHL
jgi:hypothetical protein